MQVQLRGLQAIRERAFMTQLELADKSGVAKTTVNRLERGHHAARFSTIKKLAQALGVPPEELTKPAE